MVKVAVVGLGFGAEFIPIYQRHPDAECYAICQRNEEHLNEIGEQFGIERRFTKFEELLGIDELDAIHVVSPIADHAWMSLESLKAGKHTCCTVPMATTTKDCLAIAEAREKGAATTRKPKSQLRPGGSYLKRKLEKMGQIPTIGTKV